MNQLIQQFIDTNKDNFEVISETNNDLAQALMDALVAINDLIEEEGIDFSTDELETLLNPQDIETLDLKESQENIDNLVEKIAHQVTQNTPPTENAVPDLSGLQDIENAKNLFATSFFNGIGNTAGYGELALLIASVSPSPLIDEKGITLLNVAANDTVNIFSINDKEVKGYTAASTHVLWQAYVSDAYGYLIYQFNNSRLNEKDLAKLIFENAKDLESFAVDKKDAVKTSKLKSPEDLKNYLEQIGFFDAITIPKLLDIVKYARQAPTNASNSVIETKYFGSVLAVKKVIQGINYFYFYENKKNSTELICVAQGNIGFLNIILLMDGQSVPMELIQGVDKIEGWSYTAPASAAPAPAPATPAATQQSILTTTPKVKALLDFMKRVKDKDLANQNYLLSLKISSVLTDFKISSPIDELEMDKLAMILYDADEIAVFPEDINDKTKILKFDLDRQTTSLEIEKVVNALQKGQIEMIIGDWDMYKGDWALLQKSSINLNNVFFISGRIFDKLGLIGDLGQLIAVTNEIVVPNAFLNAELLQVSASTAPINYSIYKNLLIPYLSADYEDADNKERKQALFGNVQWFSGLNWGGSPSPYEATKINRLDVLNNVLPNPIDPAIEPQLMDEINSVLGDRLIDVENSMMKTISIPDYKELLDSLPFAQVYGTKKPRAHRTMSIQPTTTQALIKKKNLNRPSPAESATAFPEGTVRIGNDGNSYIVKTNKKGINQWKPYKTVTPNAAVTGKDDDFGIDINDPALVKLQNINAQLVADLKNINVDDLDI